MSEGQHGCALWSAIEVLIVYTLHLATQSKDTTAVDTHDSVEMPTSTRQDGEAQECFLTAKGSEPSVYASGRKEDRTIELMEKIHGDDSAELKMLKCAAVMLKAYVHIARCCWILAIATGNRQYVRQCAATCPRLEEWGEADERAHSRKVVWEQTIRLGTEASRIMTDAAKEVLSKSLASWVSSYLSTVIELRGTSEWLECVLVWLWVVATSIASTVALVTLRATTSAARVCIAGAVTGTHVVWKHRRFTLRTLVPLMLLVVYFGGANECHVEGATVLRIPVQEYWQCVGKTAREARRGLKRCDWKHRRRRKRGSCEFSKKSSATNTGGTEGEKPQYKGSKPSLVIPQVVALLRMEFCGMAYKQAAEARNAQFVEISVKEAKEQSKAERLREKQEADERQRADNERLLTETVDEAIRRRAGLRDATGVDRSMPLEYQVPDVDQRATRSEKGWLMGNHRHMPPDGTLKQSELSTVSA